MQIQPETIYEAATVANIFSAAVVSLATYLGFKKTKWILGEYRPHIHDERGGALNVDGIRYPRANGK